MCDHGCACDNLLQNVLSVYCTAQAQTNESCITLAYRLDTINHHACSIKRLLI